MGSCGGLRPTRATSVCRPRMFTSSGGVLRCCRAQEPPVLLDRRGDSNRDVPCKACVSRGRRDSNSHSRIGSTGALFHLCYHPSEGESSRGIGFWVLADWNSHFPHLLSARSLIWSPRYLLAFAVTPGVEPGRTGFQPVALPSELCDLVPAGGSALDRPRLFRWQ